MSKKIYLFSILSRVTKKINRKYGKLSLKCSENLRENITSTSDGNDVGGKIYRGIYCAVSRLSTARSRRRRHPETIKVLPFPPPRLACAAFFRSGLVFSRPCPARPDKGGFFSASRKPTALESVHQSDLGVILPIIVFQAYQKQKIQIRKLRFWLSSVP